MAGDTFLLHTTHMPEKVTNNVTLGRKNKQGI